MTITFYANPNLTNHKFANCDGRWFSVHGHTIAAIPAPRVDDLMEIKETAITRQFLRPIIAKIEKLTA